MIILLIFLIAGCISNTASQLNKREFNEIKLLANKNRILADGVDFCNFNVFDNKGKYINAIIYIDSEKLDGNKFSTLKEGNYSFFAIYNNIKSNLVEIEAFKIESLEKEEIVNEFILETEDNKENKLSKIDKELEICDLLYKGEIEKVNLDLLKEINIDKSFEEFNGMNLLSIALSDFKNFDLLIRILEENRSLDFSSKDENGNTFLHFLLAIIPLEYKENFEYKWEELLNKFKEITKNYFVELLSMKNRDDISPFYLALNLKDVKRFELLTKNVNISKFFLERDSEGKTLSHYLVEIMENAEEFTNFLNILSTNPSFNLNYLSYRDGKGDSSLIYSIVLEKHDIAKVLAKRKNYKNEYIKISINYIKERCKVDDEYIDELLE